MKRRILKISSICAFATSLLIGSVSAQSSSQLSIAQIAGQLNVITPAVPLLLISPDSRASALGDAGVASTADINSLHWNAAKMATLDKEMGFSVSYTPWLRELVDDIYLAYLSGYKKLDKNSAVGISLRYFSLGKIDFTGYNGESLGSANPNEFVVEAGYARKLGRRLSGGFTGKFIYSNLTQGQGVSGGSSAGITGATDVSVYWLNEDLKISKRDDAYGVGLNISNIGGIIS